MRRRLLVIQLVVGLAWASLCGGPTARSQEVPPRPAAALQRLKDGNERFVKEQLAKKDLGKARRQQLAKGQQPFAVVLACADSRVTPELIFDQGLGDLFVIRVAGNVTDTDLIGSIEYAVSELKVPLVVVLGHDECGAVKAAVSGERLSGNLGKLIEGIHVGKDLPRDKAKALASATRANVFHSLGELTRQSPVIKDLVRTGRVEVTGGIYSLESGRVRWLERPRDRERNGRN